jgi:hypothetical protein
MAKQKNDDIVVPVNNAVRKPTEKKDFNLDGYKKKIGAEDIPDKPMTWIKISDAMEKATGLPGFAKGYVNECRGHSNTGKSTALCEGIIAAQKMGLFPIIFDTENNLEVPEKKMNDDSIDMLKPLKTSDRLSLMGFDWNGNYLLLNNKFLVDNFAIKQDKNRKEAAIEDLARAVEFFLNEQDAERLPFELVFAIDSIGTLNCIKTVNALEKDESQNNMWNAGAYEKAFMNLLNNIIPHSRKINCKYTNTMIAVQKIWIDNMNKGVVKHKGGETFYLGARLIYHFGGIITHGTKKVVAVSKVRTVNYGIETKISVPKNHVGGDLGGISMEGTIISTPHGLVYPEDIETYKKAKILYFRNILGDSTINENEFYTKPSNLDANGNMITDYSEYVQSTLDDSISDSE